MYFSVFICLIITSNGFAVQFKVLKPSKINIPIDIKKVFIDPALINDTSDKLEIKTQAIQSIKDRLNKLGRFQVFLGPPKDFDPNRETVAVIQGDIISGGDIDQGQFTEKAECKGGISGLAGAFTAKEKTQQGLTLSRRGMLCKLPNLTSDLTETGLKIGLSLLGVQEFPRLDEVIRVYKYKNFSMFAQLNLSFTQVGDQRETIAITADAASFSRHVINPETYRNVRESGDNAPIIWLWFRFSPIAPVINKKIGIIAASNPGSSPAKWYDRVTPSVSDIPIEERDQIITKLVDKTLVEFVRTISPYQVTVDIEIASGGDSEARKKLEVGKIDQAKEMLKNAKESADLYNLGLAYEIDARKPQDFEDALFYYNRAFDKSPSEKIFAQAIGRMEYQLKVANKLKKQNK